jgi:hypothetical protein
MTPRAHPAGPPDPAMVARRAAVVVAAVVVLLVASLRATPTPLASPRPELQQLDLLYLDEPAPHADALGFEGGRPGLLVVCDRCTAPAVEGAQVVVTADPDVAAAYGLRTADGRVGPGYAILDPRRHVRYRTFDPRLAHHPVEVQILLDGVR